MTGTESATGRERVSEFTLRGQRVRFLVANPADLIQREHAAGRFYEEEELAIIERAFGGGTFVDIGSNVGNHAIHAARILGASRVVAVEPNPAAFRILCRNIGLNALHDRVEALELGLSDAPGRASFVTPNPDNLGFTRLRTGAAGGGIEIRTGDSVLRGRAVDFIKIDAEGLELRILAGLRETIAARRPPIFVEVDNANQEGFLRLLETIGYRIADRHLRYPENVNFLVVPA